MARKSNANLIRIVIVGVFVAAAAGFALYQRQAARKLAADEAATWMITGAACPVPAAGAALPPLPKHMNLEETSIDREVGGAVACNTIKENGVGAALAICQFITPGTLRVTTPKGTYTFAPPRGVDSSIVIRDQVPSCVQHINPALFALPGPPT